MIRRLACRPLVIHGPVCAEGEYIGEGEMVGAGQEARWYLDGGQAAELDLDRRSGRSPAAPWSARTAASWSPVATDDDV